MNDYRRTADELRHDFMKRQAKPGTQNVWHVGLVLLIGLALLLALVAGEPDKAIKIFNWFAAHV